MRSERSDHNLACYVRDSDVPAHRGAEAGLDDPRGHAVHPNVALGQLRGQNLSQAQQGRLAHAVGAESLQKYALLLT